MASPATATTMPSSKVACIMDINNQPLKFQLISSTVLQERTTKERAFVEVSRAHSNISRSKSGVQLPVGRTSSQASPINIGGRRAVVEEKRSTSRGNRGRSSSGSAVGYRSEGARGRGNYGGGRGYGRGEIASRSNNRGYFNRGSDGYQRGENMGSSNGGRVNRPGGLAKNVAPTVTAPA
ncbi:hypothetical protein V6N13_128091 [Hibiscus sabdariffa]|uniref:Uncharacterized protein n=1 Tax=Hibiscus sabdariffa TaxID=183260 RepID=A0ABR2CF12_9ROSI